MPRFINSVFLLFFTLLLPVRHTSACDGGCPSGGGYMGILPQFSKNFAGIRYRLRTFNYRNPSVTGQFSHHRFETAEAWGRFYPGKRVQAFVFVPYQTNREVTGDATNYATGVGDISFIFNYNLINTGDSLDRTFRHNLLLGAGAKLPTGKYQQRNSLKQMYPINIQAGTGAYSGIGSIIYTIRHKKTGINANASYYYNGKNELEYSFGNMLTVNTSLFWWLKTGAFSFLPNAGTYIEKAEKDIDNGYYVNSTGGHIIYGSAGMEVYIKRLALSINYQVPVSQHLPNREQENDQRLLTSCVWLF